MTNNLFFIGLDIAAADLAASIYQSPDQLIRTKEAIPNNPEGFRLLLSWLTDHHVNKTNSRICMEATGVYSKAVACYLTSWGFPVSIEPPLKVKRAFDPVGHKTDPVDSRKIAEYAYRYQDDAGHPGTVYQTESRLKKHYACLRKADGPGYPHQQGPSGDLGPD